MSGKPQATNAQLRKLVREVLAMAPGYGFTDDALCRFVGDLLPAHAAEESRILEAAVWNLAEDYVTESTNKDTDLREWKITLHGQAKESVK